MAANCTLPAPGTTYVPPPNIRGTLDILFSCLAVVLLSTWSILHPNVPPPVSPINNKQKFMRIVWRVWGKVKWMLFNIIAPEWPFAAALNDFVCAWRMQKDFEVYAKIDNVPWTRSHTHLANMGGFVISFDAGKQAYAQHLHCTQSQRGVLYADGEVCICKSNQILLSIDRFWFGLTDLRPFGAGRA